MVRRCKNRSLTQFIGEFRNGKRDGEGLFTFANQDIYSGQWKGGKKHGKGTYRFSDTEMKVTTPWYMRYEAMYS